MTRRRPVLFFGLLAIASTAPSKVKASSEVEGAAYGGTNAGAWACGPIGRANYGGVGGRVRVAQENAKIAGKGWVGEAAAAGEYESVHIIGCDTCSAEDRIAPPDHLAFGGHARLGYHWDGFGAEVGAMGYEAYRDNTDSAPSFAGFPEAELSIGPHDEGRAIIGIGSPSITTLRRPGAYLGADLLAGDVEIEAYGGLFRSGPALNGGAAVRVDGVVLFPLDARLKFRVGASASDNEEGGLGGEGSVGLRASL